MTADEFQSIVLRLSNSWWTRHWLHWNFPNRTPWLMAIQIRDYDGIARPVKGLESLGFRWDEVDRMYHAERSNPDGTPYDGRQSTP